MHTAQDNVRKGRLEALHDLFLETLWDLEEPSPDHHWAWTCRHQQGYKCKVGRMLSDSRTGQFGSTRRHRSCIMPLIEASLFNPSSFCKRIWLWIFPNELHCTCLDATPWVSLIRVRMAGCLERGILVVWAFDYFLNRTVCLSSAKCCPHPVSFGSLASALFVIEELLRIE